MKQDTADRIDNTLGIATGEKFASCDEKEKDEQLPKTVPNKPTQTIFEPYKSKYRRRGTGSVHRISESRWEGRYTPTVNGKRVARNVYAHTEQECGQKIFELIHEMKAELRHHGLKNNMQ